MYKKLEIIFGKLGVIVFRNPIKILLFSFMILFYPIAQLPNVKIDTSTKGFMHQDDPIVLVYNDFLKQYGRDGKIVVFIKNDNIFSVDFFNFLKELHTDLENNIPYLNKVVSLCNVRNTRGEGDQLITDNLLTPLPKTQEDVNTVKKRVLESNLYEDYLLTKDFKGTVLIIQTDAYSHMNKDDFDLDNSLNNGFDLNTDTQKKFITDKETYEVVDKTIELISKYQKQGYEIHIAGAPVIMNALKVQMSSDMFKYTSITFLLIIIFLYIMFKRVTAIVYTLLIIIISVLATVGSMAWMGVPIKLPTQVVPTLLLAISVADCVHIMSIFFDKYNKTGDKESSMVYAFKHSGFGILMTSLTTAFGLGSFIGAEVAPVADLGFFAALGVLISLFLTFTVLPALLSITKLKQKQNLTPNNFDRFMKTISVIPIRYYKSIIYGSVFLFFLTLVFATQLGFTHNPLKWFPSDNQSRVSTQIVDSSMKGTVTIEAVIDSKQENGWQDPLRLKKLESFINEIESFEHEDIKTGKINSIITIIKETNQALHNNDKNFYTIPENKELIAQELLLFENSGSDDLEDIIDNQFSKARISISLPWVDAVKVSGLLEYIENRLDFYFKEESIELTGVIPLLVSTFVNSKNSSLQSYAIALCAISIMMMVTLGSFKLGLLSMIPNLSPIVFGFLIMYIFNIPLDMFTLLVGSIVLGLAVDDTIHFMHNYRRYYLLTKDSAQAITNTFFTTGKALVITTIVLSSGFFAYTQGDMVSIQNFGLLTSLIIVLALITDLLLAPALMIIVSKKGWIK